MIEVLFQAVGWIGQALFFSRFLIQWLASERAARIVVPVVFWWLSLGGSACLLAYALHEENAIFAAGAAANLFVYGRNLLLARGRRGLAGARFATAFVILVAVTIGVLVSRYRPEEDVTWLMIGAVGQAIWITRFPLQWVQSERAGHPVLSPTFFGVSLLGSLILLAYAIHTKNPIWIAGMVLVPILSMRSLFIHARSSD